MNIFCEETAPPEPVVDLEGWGLSLASYDRKRKMGQESLVHLQKKTIIKIGRAAKKAAERCEIAENVG